MIECEITGRNFEVDDKLRAYVDEKIGGLEKYLPRAAREVTTGAVVLADDPSGREDNRYVCEVVITVPGDKLVSREGTVNMYAAIDIVEAKLQSQLVKYKEKHELEPRRGRMLSRFLTKSGETAPKMPDAE